ncbi:hypothetical protein K1719_021753 [Acacia pycnantha]|nr:hypothetical protein K1719_021753 [Acacia pycnantha]
MEESKLLHRFVSSSRSHISKVGKLLGKNSYIIPEKAKLFTDLVLSVFLPLSRIRRTQFSAPVVTLSRTT